MLALEVGAGIEGDDEIDRLINDKVTPNLPTIWAMWADKALIFPRLQYLYAKRQCIEILMGQLRDYTDASLGTNLNLRQGAYFGNLTMLHQQVEIQIAALERQALAGRNPVIGELLQKSPNQPTMPPDPANPAYRGDALTPPVIQG